MTPDEIFFMIYLFMTLNVTAYFIALCIKNQREDDILVSFIIGIFWPVVILATFYYWLLQKMDKKV